MKILYKFYKDLWREVRGTQKCDLQQKSESSPSICFFIDKTERFCFNIEYLGEKASYEAS